MGKRNLSALSIALCQYVLGKLPGERIPEIAMTLLEDGNENDELIELVGMKNPAMADVEDVFLRGLNKLGIHLPSVDDATVYLAKKIAKKIIDGKIKPYDGAHEIWWDLANIENADKRLKVFVGLSSEYEDITSHESRKCYEKEILKEAYILLEERA